MRVFLAILVALVVLYSVTQSTTKANFSMAFKVWVDRCFIVWDVSRPLLLKE
jgi:hypothetical protein